MVESASRSDLWRGLLLRTVYPKHKTTGRCFKVTASRCAEDSEHCGNPGNGLLLDATLYAYVRLHFGITTRKNRTRGAEMHGECRGRTFGVRCGV